MKLTKIHIKNYRGLEDLSLSLKNMTSLIGANNVGKSSILKALDLFLNQGKPKKSDWFEGKIERSIVIHGTFEQIEEWERDQPGVSSLVQDNKIELRVMYELDADDKIATSWEAFVSLEIIEGLEKTKTNSSETVRNIAANLGIVSAADFKTAANQERIKTAIRESHSELVSIQDSCWTSEGISIAPALKQAIPQAVFIPASSNFSDEANGKAKTPFAKLLETVIVPAVESTEEYSEFISSIESLIEKIRSRDNCGIPEVQELSSDLTDRLQSIIPGAEVILGMDAPEVQKIVSSGASVRINDGFETDVDCQGHGAQRSLIFSLIESLANRDRILERTSGQETIRHQRGCILLFEEPELYLHPHYMRRLKSALSNISNSENWQVVLTTHSPFLINVAEDPCSLVILNKNTERLVELKQLEINPFSGDTMADEREALRAVIDFCPTVCEAFFAQRVVLVEGDSEVAIFNHGKELLELCELEPDLVDETTIVSCDGKWTIVPIARVLKELGIEFRVVHDLDAKGRTPEQLAETRAIDPYRANAKIENVCGGNIRVFRVDDTLESLITDGDNLAKSDKPYRAWKRVKNIIDDRDLDSYEEFKNLIRFVYDWTS